MLCQNRTPKANIEFVLFKSNVMTWDFNCPYRLCYNCKWMLVWARHQRRLFISHSFFFCTNIAFLLQIYAFRQNVCIFFLFSSAVLSCIPRQSIVVCCIWCSILIGEKRLYFVALVAFRIRLRLGRVRFVLFVFQCGFHVVALFFTVFFFLVSIMHAKNTTTKHSKWWKKPIQFFWWSRTICYTFYGSTWNWALFLPKVPIKTILNATATNFTNKNYFCL